MVQTKQDEKSVEPAKQQAAKPEGGAVPSLADILQKAEQAYAAYMDAQKDVAEAYRQSELDAEKAYKASETRAKTKRDESMKQAIEARDEVLAGGVKAHDEAVKQAEQVYKQAEQAYKQAEQAYKRAAERAGETYQGCELQAKGACDGAIKQALRTYEQTTGLAWKKREETTQQAWNIYTRETGGSEQK